MKKISILLLLLPLLLSTAWAQTNKSTYRQFFFNPYLYNPAFAGINGKTELNMVYKKQWIGFNDAPSSTGVNLQMPTSDRVVIALNVISNTEMLLRNTSFTGTFAYVVPIDKKQSIRFGLSGGMGMKKLDLTAEELNTTDPAILNAASTNHYVDGNFGFVYTNAGLKVGVALTELFQSDPFQQEFNEFSLSNLNNRRYSLSYRFNMDPFGKFSLEPYVLYNQTASGVHDAWEAASIIHFQDKLWTGASYHEQRGLSMFFGMNVMEKFRFSYSYEFPPFQKEAPSFSSHELQLTLRLGKNKTRGYAANTAASENNDLLVTDDIID